METTIHLTLSEDLNSLFSIYQIKPEYFLQKFIEQISLPGYYSSPNNEDRWGTQYFLRFLEAEQDHCKVNRKIEQQYLTIFNKAMRVYFEANIIDSESMLADGRKIIRQWEKAALAKRSKYITDRF